jgi:hypothetical protein
MENKSKRQKREQEREIINEYHQFVTRKLLTPLMGG